jgi:inner membrane protein
MNPVSHLLIGWVTANTCDLNRRERAAVTIAAVIPDLDGLGMIAETATKNTAHPLLWWSQYHHVLGHNVLFAVACTCAAFALTGRRWRTAALACLSFHLHLLGDIVGARGPDGDQWPIPYLWPFSDAWQLTWSGQWALNAWPNMLITGTALAVIFYLARARGFSPLEMVSTRADAVFVNALRRRFPVGMEKK